MGQLKKVVFLDRDGTINRDSADYIKSRAEFEFIPGSLEAIGKLTAHGFTVMVITNQSALARNLLSPAELDAIHAEMCDAVAAAGGRITDIFFCPHLPGQDCDCRKPAPGLILRACQKYDCDPADAVMVGDSLKDVACGRSAGCRLALRVRSGLAPEVENQFNEMPLTADFVAADLLEAAAWIIDHYENAKSIKRCNDNH